VFGGPWSVVISGDGPRTTDNGQFRPGLESGWKPRLLDALNLGQGDILYFSPLFELGSSFTNQAI